MPDAKVEHHLMAGVEIYKGGTGVGSRARAARSFGTP